MLEAFLINFTKPREAAFDKLYSEYDDWQITAAYRLESN